MGWVNDLGADIRYGFRQMRRAPVFTATVLVTLAAGIGLNTAVFSVIDAVLVRSLSYPDPERVVWIATVDRYQDLVTSLDFVAWKEQATTFDRLVAFDTNDYAIQTADNTVQSRVAWVSEDFWAVSGATPMLGRLPLSGEDAVLPLVLVFRAGVSCRSRGRGTCRQDRRPPGRDRRRAAAWLSPAADETICLQRSSGKSHRRLSPADSKAV